MQLFLFLNKHSTEKQVENLHAEIFISFRFINKKKGMNDHWLI